MKRALTDALTGSQLRAQRLSYLQYLRGTDTKSYIFNIRVYYEIIFFNKEIFLFRDGG